MQNILSPKKPKLFIASSSEAIELAHAAQQNLERYCDVTVWDQGAVKPSTTTLESLVSVVYSSDFGVFVFSPDDTTISRSEELRTVRDNVIWELGLFVGRLGKSRCFILSPRGFPSLHLPSDLLGLKTCDYDARRSDKRAALGAACTEIGSCIVDLGCSFGDGEQDLAPMRAQLTAHTRISEVAGYWLSRFDYKAYRNRRWVRGTQYGLERLIAINQESLWGANVLCSGNSTKQYSHDLRLRVLGLYVLGTWVNTNTHNFGCFQLHIDTGKSIMRGQCLGNANDNSIQSGAWLWFKLADSDRELTNRLIEKAPVRLREFAVLEERWKIWLEREIPLNFEEIVA